MGLRGLGEGGGRIVEHIRCIKILRDPYHTRQMTGVRKTTSSRDLLNLKVVLPPMSIL